MNKKYFKFYIFQLFFIFSYFIQPIYAQTPDQTIRVEEQSIWITGNYFNFTMSDKQIKQNITVTVHDLNNLSIQFDGEETGNLKLLEGKTLITQGFDTTDKFMIDKLDGASLYTQLIINLLEVAIPEGPQLTTTKQINIKETKKDLSAGTMSAGMGVPPPWELTGTATPKNGIISFDFKFHAQGQDLFIKGSWEKRNPAPQFDDTMSLEGWKMYKLGPREFKEGNDTILDYGTTGIPFTEKTLGELRQNLSNTQ